MKRTAVRLALGVVAVAAVAAALLVVLAVSSLSWIGHSAEAQAVPALLIRHVNPDGSDFTGNPFCPQTVWSADGQARVVAVDPRHDCNNVVGQNHVIRTEGYELIADNDGDGNPRAGNPVVGAAETLCDGLDNDADTTVDDGTCAYPETPPNDCNAIDDDSDGVIDDGQCLDEDPVDGVDNDGDGLIDEDPPNITSWTLQNLGANAQILTMGNCWTQVEVQNRPAFSPENWNEQCLVIRSTSPGETVTTASYDVPSALPPIFGQITDALVKGWDTFVDTVILKATDVESVTVPGVGSQRLPGDADGDGNRDAADEHLMDHNGETQEHAVIFDDALMRLRSAEGPVQLIESAHGQHVDFPDHPTEGAVVLAFIDSPRGCTYFTDPTGQADYGSAVMGIADWRGFFIGPKVWPVGTQFTAEALAEAAAHGLSPSMSNNGPDDTAVDDLLGVYVDTMCEEQATITFKVGYPSFVASVPEIPDPEWVRINWFTIEIAKQPQIRWAGEEIVLEKRWALPGEWFPEPGGGIDNDGDGLINEDPADDDGDGLINEEFPPDGVDTDEDGNEDGSRADPGFGNCNDGMDNDADTEIDYTDVSCAAFIDEDTGISPTEDDDDDCVGDPPVLPVPSSDGFCGVAGGIDEDGPDACPWAGYLVRYTKLGGPGTLIAGVPNIEPGYPDPDNVWTVVDQSCVARALYSSDDPGEVDVEATLRETLTSPPVNRHAFLVWYLKIYQVKLTNVPLADNVGREFHNAGVWGGEDPVAATGVTQETLNVSQDALARAQVKGWFRGAYLSGRSAICIDMDGDGDGAGSEPGEPYSTPYLGCADTSDEFLDHGYWVLPDDIEALAGPSPDRLATWDVMSEPNVAADELIGYKSTLDSHDDVLRRVVDCVVLRPDGSPDFDCRRKTVDPDGQITDADAIMPPLKILAQILDNEDGVVDVGESGFLKAADKDGDLNILSAYSRAEIPASPWIPAFVSNGGYAWDSWGYNLPGGMAQGPYSFFDILTKYEEFDSLGRPYTRSLQFYTDNRGLGYFFVNGDFKLTFDECPMQQLSGAPDCSPRDVVGKSVVTVVGDYPYFRKFPAVESNAAEKTWIWGGFTSITAGPIDATHTAIIAHLKDRDGYCKWDVGADPTQADSVIFSPSLNEVQHGWIEFLLNTDVGEIVDVSPNALYLGDVADQHSLIDPGLPRWQIVQIRDHVHAPLAEERSTGLEEGFIFEADRAALARAEDVRVLNFYSEGRSVDARHTDPAAPDECQAWVHIEHPADQTPNISVIFHDPEGNIDRHWPSATRDVPLASGWNEVCYTGPNENLGAALAGITDDVVAIYRLRADQGFDRWFPTRPDISTIGAFGPYDQLFILTSGNASWLQEITIPPAGPPELADGWNSVCYTGPMLPPPEATAEWGEFAILYQLQSDWQGWCRYIPGRPEVSNCGPFDTFDSVMVLVAEGTEFCAPVLPGTYSGTVTINGTPAFDGTAVTGSIGGNEWASTSTAGGRYVFDIPATLPAVPACFSGGQVTFTANGGACQESAMWNSGPHELNLTCSGGPPTVIRVEPSERTCYVGHPCSVDVVVDNVTNLGAFEFTMDFDPSMIQFVQFEQGPFLGSTGRSVSCSSFHVADGSERFGCASGSPAGEPGPNGSGVVASVGFAPLTQGGSAISLESTGMFDTEAEPIAHVVQYGYVTVSACYGDVDGDGDVDIRDVALVFAHWPSPPLLYAPQYDMDGDGDIDIRDVQLVFAQWPKVCTP